MSNIVLKNVCKSYDKEHYAVQDFSLEIPDREFVIFVGPSGCGKSTIANMLLSLIKPDSGTIEIDGTIQIIFQHPETSLDPAKKIGYSLEEPMIIHRMYDKAGRKARVRELLDLVDLGEELLDRYPHQTALPYRSPRTCFPGTCEKTTVRNRASSSPSMPSDTPSRSSLYRSPMRTETLQ